MKQNLLKDEAIPASIKALGEKMTRGEEGLGQYDAVGGSHYLAYAPIEGTNWSLALEVPKEEVTAKLSAFTFISIGLSLIILVLTCAAGAFAARRLIRPITRLNEQVEFMDDVRGLPLLGLGVWRLADHLDADVRLQVRLQRLPEQDVGEVS